MVSTVIGLQLINWVVKSMIWIAAGDIWHSANF
ncbi:hypothetical protein HNO89_002676 [Sporosarcina luteola]|nr:hypothetical protein [Sporosarcina luteola]